MKLNERPGKSGPFQFLVLTAKSEAERDLYAVGVF